MSLEDKVCKQESMWRNSEGKKKKGSNLVWEDLEKEEEWPWDKVV